LLSLILSLRGRKGTKVEQGFLLRRGNKKHRRRRKEEIEHYLIVQVGSEAVRTSKLVFYGKEEQEGEKESHFGKGVLNQDTQVTEDFGKGVEKVNLVELPGLYSYRGERTVPGVKGVIRAETIAFLKGKQRRKKKEKEKVGSQYVVGAGTFLGTGEKKRGGDVRREH